LKSWEKGEKNPQWTSNLQPSFKKSLEENSIATFSIQLDSEDRDYGLKGIFTM